MPHFDIVVRWEAPDSFRAQSVIGTYSLLAVKLEKRFKGEIPIENLDWNIGVIVGRSGTGKTSIAKQLWPESYIRSFTYSKPCFLDDFTPAELKVKDIESALNATGFNTPPDWLKSYECLSQGEKMRADVARALTLNQDLIVFDEWTSVVDRTVAQIASLAISKQIRRGGKKFIAVTCHYDVLDWLEPDWVFCTDDMKFVKKKRQHPEIRLEVRKCRRELWETFSSYHYLTGSLSSAARCYAAYYNAKPIAFIAVQRVHMGAHYFRVGRLVVLPDYQGIGIGKRLLNRVAELYTSQIALPFYIVTTNPQIIRASLGPNWIVKRFGHSGKIGVNNDGFMKVGKMLERSSSSGRITVSLQYVPKSLVGGHE